MSWEHLLDGNQGKVPEHLLIAFVEKHFGRLHPKSLRFLDIGPGRHGPNQWHLEMQGYDVISVDIAARAKKNLMADVHDLDFPTGHFDFIYDVNTLCHVERPPMERICQWLKLGGMFFTIAPASTTWRGVGDGKEFTRYASKEEIEDMHSCFSGGSPVRLRTYPSGDDEIHSWVSWWKK